MDFLFTGYVSLFALSFLAATFIPLGSEWLLVVLLVEKLDPAGLLLAATAGNVAGALTTWAIGVWGGPYLMKRVLRVGPDEVERARGYYERWGSWSLLLAWVPVIGDPLCLLAGILRISLLKFLMLVTVGKFGRYAFITAAVLGAG